MERKSDLIDVVFCLTDPKGNYIQHTATAMLSILENTKAEVQIHVIHDDTLTLTGKSRLEEISQRRDQPELPGKICYHQLDREYFEKVAETAFGKEKKVSVGTLYRLKIDEILPVCSKVIYLDSDVIVNMDLSALWRINVDNYFCAAVRDVSSTRNKWKNRSAFRKMNIETAGYFNAGVLLLNLDVIRHKMSLWNSAMYFFEKYGRNSLFFDQDALNSLLQKKTKFLSDDYNFIPVAINTNNLCEEKKAIIHYAGPKPWSYRCSSYDWLYWKYFSMTPWGDTPEKLLDAQKKVGIDLGYALQTGKVASRKNLVKGVFSIFS